MKNESSKEDHLLTIKEVARRLASSVRHVWRLIAKGELPKPVHVGALGPVVPCGCGSVFGKTAAGA